MARPGGRSRRGARPTGERALDALGRRRPRGRRAGPHGAGPRDRADLGRRRRCAPAARAGVRQGRACRLRQLDGNRHRCGSRPHAPARRGSRGLRRHRSRPGARRHDAGRRPAADHPAQRVGGRPVQAAQRSQLRRRQARVRPSHRQPQRLRAGPVGRDRAGHLPVPPGRPRVGRHRLQLPRRPLRPDLRGPGGRHRPAGGGRAGQGLQSGLDRRRKHRHLQHHLADAGGHGRARAGAGLEADAARRTGDGASPAGHAGAGPQRSTEGQRAAPQPDLGSSRRQFDRLSRQRALRPAADPAPAGRRHRGAAHERRARRGAQSGPVRAADRAVGATGPGGPDAHRWTAGGGSGAAGGRLLHRDDRGHTGGRVVVGHPAGLARHHGPCALRGRRWARRRRLGAASGGRRAGARDRTGAGRCPSQRPGRGLRDDRAGQAARHGCCSNAGSAAATGPRCAGPLAPPPAGSPPLCAPAPPGPTACACCSPAIPPTPRPRRLRR